METSIEELDGSNRKTVWEVSKSLPYAPKQHCIRIGSGPGKYSSALDQIQYRNVKIYATQEVAQKQSSSQRIASRTFPLKSTTQYYPYLEWELPAKSDGKNPYDVAAHVTFIHTASKTKASTEMYYDGKGRFKFRFTGTQTGTWDYLTSSEVDSLDGIRGQIEVTPKSQ
ncbi:DUF5060 domain-containing protein [Bremerella sp. T1]|uniref:DUF5060 domain-containing protein n=1 Tax=Bremerella sp. TYQ1 TaxID=3119568 RepID=UPI001CC908EE|nr:DUF5060 domain-containing protein [Bremerella volcania]